MTSDDLKTKIRHVPDFPKAGILFYDITTLLQDPAGLRAESKELRAIFAKAARTAERNERTALDNRRNRHV